MRYDLLDLYRKKVNFVGVVSGFRRSRSGLLMLLKPLYYEGCEVVDHVWVKKESNKFPKDLNIGDFVTFRGKIKRYRRLNGSQDITVEPLKLISILRSEEV